MLKTHREEAPPAKKVSWLKCSRHILLSTLLCAFLWLLSPLAKFDVFWSDLLLARQGNRVPHQVLVIPITPEDVISNGMERLSRKYLASTLTLLSNAGVKRVLLDLNMARMSTPAEETEVLAALKLLGPKRIGFAFESNSSLKPGEKLRAEATTLNLSLIPDYDGRLRSINGSLTETIANPCIWLSSGELNSRSSAIDLRYDPRTIRRVSLSELHAGKVPIEAIKNSCVIIAHSRELSRTRVQLPLYGPTDRGTVFAIATASSLGNYSSIAEQRLQYMTIFSSLLTFASLYVGYKSTTIARIGNNFLRIFALVMVVCFLATSLGGIPTKPASLTLNCLAIVSISIADRLRVFELFKGLASGVLSPEEVWVWRTYGDRETPVLLFDAMGHIKKANSSAVVEFQLDPKTLSRQHSDLAKQCMPSLGEQKKQLTLQTSVKKIWEIQWPSGHLPIALFNDITAEQSKLEELQSQLMTDPLTGVLNRKGFQSAIEKLDSSNDRNYTVFFMDMNGFKAVNDQYGHGAGDTLLKVTAQRFRNAISKDEYVARFGGDEFAILIPRRISPEEALLIRERIESSLIERIDVGDAVVQIGVAAGFSIPFDEHESREAILERADLDMYQRKMFMKRDRHAIKPASSNEPSPGFPTLPK